MTGPASGTAGLALATSKPRVIKELLWRTGYSHPEKPDSHYWRVTLAEEDLCEVVLAAVKEGLFSKFLKFHLTTCLVFQLEL